MPKKKLRLPILKRRSKNKNNYSSPEVDPVQSTAGVQDTATTDLNSYNDFMPQLNNPLQAQNDTVQDVNEQNQVAPYVTGMEPEPFTGFLQTPEQKKQLAQTLYDYNRQSSFRKKLIDQYIDYQLSRGWNPELGKPKQIVTLKEITYLGKKRMAWHVENAYSRKEFYNALSDAGVVSGDNVLAVMETPWYTKEQRTAAGILDVYTYKLATKEDSREYTIAQGIAKDYNLVIPDKSTFILRYKTAVSYRNANQSAITKIEQERKAKEEEKRRIEAEKYKINNNNYSDPIQGDHTIVYMDPFRNNPQVQENITKTKEDYIRRSLTAIAYKTKSYTPEDTFSVNVLTLTDEERTRIVSEVSSEKEIPEEYVWEAMRKIDDANRERIARDEIDNAVQKTQEKYPSLNEEKARKLVMSNAELSTVENFFDERQYQIYLQVSQLRAAQKSNDKAGILRAQNKLKELEKLPDLYDPAGNPVDKITGEQINKKIDQNASEYAGKYSDRLAELFLEKYYYLQYFKEVINMREDFYRDTVFGGRNIVEKNQTLKQISYQGADIKFHLTEQQERARRYVKLYNEAAYDFEAISRAYLLNEDISKEDKGTWGGFLPALGEGLVEGTFGVEVKTNQDVIDHFVSSMSEAEIPLSQQQLEDAKRTLSQNVGSAIGQSIPVMASIVVTTLVTEGVGTIPAIARAGAIIENTLIGTYGAQRGAQLYSIYRTTLVGATSFALAGQSSAAGGAEGATQGVLNFKLLEKFGGKYGKLVALGMRVFAGATAETVQEYAGNFADNLLKQEDLELAFKETFGRDINEASEKFLITGLTAAFFSGGFNTAQLITYKTSIENNVPDSKEKEAVLDILNEALGENGEVTESTVTEEEVKPKVQPETITTETPVTKEANVIPTLIDTGVTTITESTFDLETFRNLVAEARKPYPQGATESILLRIAETGLESNLFSTQEEFVDYLEKGLPIGDAMLTYGDDELHAIFRQSQEKVVGHTQKPSETINSKAFPNLTITEVSENESEWAGKLGEDLSIELNVANGGNSGDVLLEEFGHVWIELTDRIDNSIIDNLIPQVKKTAAYNNLKEDPHYKEAAELSSDAERYITKEILAQAIRTNGANIQDAVSPSAFREFMDKVWEAVRKALKALGYNIPESTDLSQIKTVQEFVRIARSEVTGEKAITEASSSDLLDFLEGRTNTLEIKNSVLAGQTAKGTLTVENYYGFFDLFRFPEEIKQREIVKTIGGLKKIEAEKLTKEDITILSTLDAAILNELKTKQGALKAKVAEIEEANIIEKYSTTYGMEKSQTIRIIRALSVAKVNVKDANAVSVSDVSSIKEIDELMAVKDVLKSIEVMNRMQLDTKLTAEQIEQIAGSLAKDHGTTDPIHYQKKVAKIGDKEIKAYNYGTNKTPLKYGSDIDTLNAILASMGIKGENLSLEDIIQILFSKGFPARGGNIDLGEHALHKNGPSAFMGTTEIYVNADETAGAILWAGDGGVVFLIDNVPGWDLNSTIGENHPTVGEQEISVLAQIPPEHIQGVYFVKEINGKLKKTEFVANPNYKKTK